MTVDEALARGKGLVEIMRTIRSQIIRAALARHRNCVSLAAVELGVSREGLVRMMKTLGIPTRGKRGRPPK